MIYQIQYEIKKGYRLIFPQIQSLSMVNNSINPLYCIVFFLSTFSLVSDNMRLIFAFLIVISQGNSYNEKDIQIITSLLQPLIIKHCILIISVQDQVSIISLKIRLFSEKNVFAVYFDISDLVKYLKTGKFPNARTATILKVKDNSQLSSISAKLKFQVSKKKWSNIKRKNISFYNIIKAEISEVLNFYGLTSSTGAEWESNPRLPFAGRVLYH